MELTPKATFQKSQAAKFHIDLVGKPEFHAALQASLASYALSYGVTQERLKGATDMIDTILNLAEPPKIGKNEGVNQNLWQNPPPSHPLPRQQLLEKARAPRPPRQP